MTSFNPSEHTVEEVEKHLADHPEEAVSVVEAEKADKNRKGIVERSKGKTVHFTRVSPDSGALTIESSED